MKALVQLCIIMMLVCIGNMAIASDTIIIKKDPRMDVLSTKQAEANKRITELITKGTYKGFRVQVLSTRSREAAFDLRATLQFSFSEHKSYVSYQSPNFRVRIGNFLTREDAENFRKQLLKTYPEGLYIVEDTVEYTPPEDDEML